MVDDIIGYVKSNFERGIDVATIKQNLLGQGHSDYDIDKAINQVEMEKNGETDSEEEEIDLE